MNPNPPHVNPLRAITRHIALVARKVVALCCVFADLADLARDGAASTMTSTPNQPPAAPALVEFLVASTKLSPGELGDVGSLFARAVGAKDARIFIVDYAHQLLIPLGPTSDPTEHLLLEGTIAGRVFCDGDTITTHGDSTFTYICLTEGSERFGVIVIEHDQAREGLEDVLEDALRILVLTIVSKRRYTDVILRTRRARPLSVAAEMQWDLLPPLSCSTAHAAISGTLEPAYSTGGDSFDYALNETKLDFAIIDAVGHGLPAILKSALAVNTIRNARRQGADLIDAYKRVDTAIQNQFGESNYVTGVIASLDFGSGELRWINAGHHLPMVVRNGSLIPALTSTPSLPMGLGGQVREVKSDFLEPDDRVLFYTDGVVEGRSAAGSIFGTQRLGDLFLRTSLEGVSTAETARRLTKLLLAHCGDGILDDATLVVVHYKGGSHQRSPN